MKAKLDFRSKRTIIITAIIAALAVGAGVGAYFYAKGNNEASASTEISDAGQTATEQAPTGENNQGNSDSNAGNGNENGATGENAENNGATNNGTDANANADNAGNNGTANNGNTGNAGNVGNAGNGAAGNGATNNDNAGAGDNDGDATTTTENIVVENPWESHSVNWRPQSINVSTPEVNVNVNKIVVTKRATTSTGYDSVSEGEWITYTITATNNNSETLNSLYISDEIPEGTTFDSAENGGETIKENDVVTKVYWNLWNLGIEPGKTYSVSFKVIVNKGAKGTIKNVAIVEDEPSNKDENGDPTPTKNPVFESSKTSVINRVVDEKETIVKEPAQKGDKVIYTITVKNTGDVDGTTKITDADLKEILNEEKGIATIVGEVKAYENDKEKTAPTLEQLISGYEETISKKSTYKVEYTIELKNVDGNITNTAIIGNTPNTEVVETADIQVEKEVSKITRDGKELDFKAEDFKGVIEGDIITYNITVKNNGSTDLHDVVVNESLGVEGNLEIESLKAGESKSIEVTYTLTAKDVNDKREVKNVVTATGKTPDDEEITSDPSEVETPIEKVINNLEVEKKVSADNKNFTKDSVKLGNGETAYFQIRIKNTSNVSMDVNVTDILSKDEETIGEDLLSKLTYKDGTAFENGTTLKPEEEITLYTSKEIDQTIVNDVNKLTNTVTATGTETNPEDPENPETTEPTTDTAEVEVKKPKMVAKKKSSAEGKIVKPGDTIKYTITITNGGETTGNIDVIDNLPDQVTFKSAKIANGGENTKTISIAESEDKKHITIKVTELSNEARKNSVEVEIETIVNDFSDEDAEKGVEIKNEITVDGKIPEEGTTTDTASKPVISVEKSSTYTTNAEETDSNTKKIHAGDEIVYTMIVKNSGLVEANGLKIEDPIPAKVTLAKENAITIKVTDKDGNEVNSQLGEVTKTEINDETTSTKLTWSNATIGAEQTATIMVKVTANDLDEGKYTAHINNNTIKVDEVPTTDEKDYDVVTPAITVEKEVKSLDGNNLDKKTVSPGTQIMYLITAKNENGTEAGEVTITDTLDTENLVNISAKAIITRAGSTNATEETVEVNDGVISKTYTINPKDIITIEVTATTRAFKENEKDSYIIKNKAEYVTDGKEDETDEVVVIVFEKRISLDVAKTVSTDNENFAETVIVGDKETAYFKITIKNKSNIEVVITANDVMTADGEVYNENMKLYTDKDHRNEFLRTTLAKSGEESDSITLYAKQEIDETIVKTIDKFINTVSVTGEDASEDLGDKAEPVTETDTAEVEVKKPTITATIKKVWDDADNQDGKRPTELKVTLSNGTEDVKEVTLNDGNKWTATEYNLPKYANGQEITYTWAEADLSKEYELTDTKIEKLTSEKTEAEETLTTLTNSHKPETINIPVEKTWKDNNDGKMPTSITVNLLADGVAALDDSGEPIKATIKKDKDGKWKHTFESLPKYKNGQEIEYTITENEIAGYNTTINGYSIENELITTTATVIKVWDDYKDIDGLRPKNITVQLKADGENYGEPIILSKDNCDVSTISEKEIWQYTFTDLRKVNISTGNDYNYTVVETKIGNEAVSNNKTSDYTVSTAKDNSGITTITNTHESKVEIKVEKVWEDGNKSHNSDSVTIKLFADGTDTKKTVTLSKSNSWKSEFRNLDKYKDGTKINYTVEEANVPDGYIVKVDGDATKGYKVTNVFVELAKSSKTSTEGTDKVKAGDTITYTITAKNNGTEAIKNYKVTDSDLLDLINDGKIVMMNGESEATIADNCITVSGNRDNISANTLGTGYTIPSIAAGEKVTITVKVKVVKALPGDDIVNTLGDKSTKVTNEVTANINLYKTVENPQEAVIIIDLSLSMAQAVNVPDSQKDLKDPMAYTYEATRWYALTEALDSFIDSFMKNEGNRITILGYNENTKLNGDYILLNSATTAIAAKNIYKNVFTKSQFNTLKNAVNNFNQNEINTWNNKYDTDIDTNANVREIDVDGLRDTSVINSNNMTLLGSGTNIEAGLLATNYQLSRMTGDSDKNVILMTDGVANRRVTNPNTTGDNYEVEKNPSQTNKENGIKNAANKIKDSGATLFTVGFSNDADNILSTIASSDGDGGKYYYKSTDMESLEEYFEQISEKLIPYEIKGVKTEEGKLVLSGENTMELDTASVKEIIVVVDGTTVLDTNSWSGFSKYFSSTSTTETIDVRAIVDDYNKTHTSNPIEAVLEDISITISQ